MFLGVVMILMLFQNKGWIEVILSNNMFHNNTKKRDIGTFITGLLSVFSSVCSTPVLIVILSLSASHGGDIGFFTCYVCNRL